MLNDVLERIVHAKLECRFQNSVIRETQLLVPARS